MAPKPPPFAGPGMNPGRARLPCRVHVVGASGSGTTTLGRALAERRGCPLFDTDDYFWLPTDPPFQEIRPLADRQALLDADLRRHDAWVLSGSLCGWGDVFIPLFDLVVFLCVEVLREPAAEAYRERVVVPSDGRVSPLAFPDVVIRVGDLFV